MYDELVKVLRETDFSDGCPCGTESLCNGKDCVILQAADAIEEMNRRIDRAIELYNRNAEKSAMYEALVGISQEPAKEEK